VAFTTHPYLFPLFNFIASYGANFTFLPLLIECKDDQKSYDVYMGLELDGNDLKHLFIDSVKVTMIDMMMGNQSKEVDQQSRFMTASKD
jgi:hypothetical protein